MMKTAVIFALTFSLFSSAAFAETVEVTGCAQNGVESGCLVIKDKAGKTYDITAADPKPDLSQKLAITVTGEISQDRSSCNQGIVLKNIKFSYTKMACKSDESGLK